MEFTNEFTTPADVDTTFATLTDLEKVASCVPGATLQEVDGDTYSGKVKVKVGPIQVTYAGTARVTEADAVGKRGRIEANGRETRGAGTARADVVAQLEPTAEGTRVTVTTDLSITGRAAQFGRGMMAEVGTRIIDTFADRLNAMLEEEAAPLPEPTATPPAGPTETRGSREDEVLDVMQMSGPSTAARFVPVAALIVALLGLLWWRRRR